MKQYETFKRQILYETDFRLISDGRNHCIGKIAKEIGLSEKSVRNRLNELSDFLLENKLGEIQRKPRVGIWLEANENKTKRRNTENIIRMKICK